jgi:hypothetical protein
VNPLPRGVDLDRITSTLLLRGDVDESRAQQMLDLFKAHFDGVDDLVFREDLDEKTHVLLLEDPVGVVGFTTLHLYTTEFRGDPISVLFSGDTIVAPEARKSLLLSSSWIGAVESIRATRPDGRPFYWFLICSGFRTYRFLPLFFQEFYPRHNEATPAQLQELMHQLASGRYGANYSRETGVVRLPGRQAPLRTGEGTIPDSRRKNPHIAFFEARNPRHMEGEELVCITRPVPDNLTRAGERMITAAMKS